MHINDVYALRSFMRDLLEKGKVDTRTARALMEAAHEEVSEFEQRLELMALAEEAAQQ
jgi:ribosomal protein L19E